jgi:hypothetical protein
VTCSMKNKGKEKVVENFINDKVSCKAIILWYIPVSTRKEGQYHFTKDEEKINKGLKNLTFPITDLALNKVSKPLLKGFFIILIWWLQILKDSLINRWMTLIPMLISF